MLPVLALGLLGACATLGMPVKSDNVPFCLVAQPVVIDMADVLTEDTAKQIEDGICRGVQLCGWEPRGLDCD